MTRKISETLQRWRLDPCRKPLLVQGARQVGKTFSVLEFGKQAYENVAYFNFRTNPQLAKAFEGDLRPSCLLPVLSHLSRETITRGATLIVFDEIQLCERALTSMEAFCEEAPQVHVIGVGSLPGLAVNGRQNVFPEEKVDRCTMTPMNMEEFLMAVGEEELVRRIRSCFEENRPMPAALHEAALRRYRQVLVIGGMPKAVARFVETQDDLQVRHVQETIQMDLLADMSKTRESTNEGKKTRLTYSTIAAQLSKHNKRFQYSVMKRGGHSGAV